MKRRTVVKKRYRPDIPRNPPMRRRVAKKASKPVTYPNGYTLEQTQECVHRGGKVGSYGGG